jgi:hypothetical protein
MKFYFLTAFFLGVCTIKGLNYTQSPFIENSKPLVTQLEPCPKVTYKPIWKIELVNGALIYAANVENNQKKDSVYVTYQYIDTDDCKLKTVKITIKSTSVKDVGLTEDK